MQYRVSGEALEKVANAIREKGGTTEALIFPDGFVKAVRAISGSGSNEEVDVTPSGGEWVRPEEWPDLDSLMTDDFEGAYYTVDMKLARETSDGEPLMFNILGRYTGHLDVGYVDENGFHSYENLINGTEQFFNNITHVSFSYRDDDYLVVRIDQDMPIIANGNNVPIVEEYFRSKNAGSLSGNAIASGTYFSSYVRHAKWIFTDTTHVGSWGTGKYSLIKNCNMIFDVGEMDTSNWTIGVARAMFANYMGETLDLSHWDTSKWEVYDIGLMFSNCKNLRHIDLSNWDTSNWAVVNLDGMFSGCTNLESVNLSGWDTSNWAVTTLKEMFKDCANLKTVNLSGWDTSNWAVSSLESMFYGDGNLRSVDLSGWNTSNWAVTSLKQMFRNCRGIQSIDLSGWDTSNWAVTDASYMFAGCDSLRNVDFLSNWNVTNWNVQWTSEMFSYCYRIREIPIQEWNTSNWEVKEMFQMFRSCTSLKHIPITEWDTSNWVVTRMDYMFHMCESIEDCDLTSWNTSNWAVTQMQNAFDGLANLRTFDVHGWDTSNWAVTNATRFLYGTKVVKANFSGWDMSNWNVQNSTFISNNNALRLIDFTGCDLSGFKRTDNNGFQFINSNLNLFCIKPPRATPVAKTVEWRDCTYLSKNSIIGIFNALPVVTNGNSLRIVSDNMANLTDDERAIATDKGWTLL